MNAMKSTILTARLAPASIAVVCAMMSGATAGQQIPTPTDPPVWPQPSRGFDREASADKLVKITATADTPQVAPGETFHLAFIFEIEPQWHTYWRNAGAGGSGTVIQVTGPQGFTIGRTLFPRPKIYIGEEGISYGYGDKVVLYVEVTAPPMLKTGSENFNARITFMVCKEVCLLGRKNVNIQVLTRIGNTTEPNPLLKPVDPVTKEFKSRLPKKLSDLAGAESRFELASDNNSGTLHLKLPAQGFSTAEFFPVELPGITFEEPVIAKDGDFIQVTVPVDIRPQNSLGGEMRIVGTVGLGEKLTDPSYDFDIPLPRNP